MQAGVDMALEVLESVNSSVTEIQSNMWLSVLGYATNIVQDSIEQTAEVMLGTSDLIMP